MTASLLAAESAPSRSTGAGTGVALTSVSVVLPVFNEAGRLSTCLQAICRQDYPLVLEVLVVDGGSSDGTAELAASFAAARPEVQVLANPRRSRPAGMNVGVRAAAGEVVVRVDARAVLAPDYVRRCVEALARTGAAIVGGPMRLEAGSPASRGVKAAMASRLGGGPAAFRREEPRAGFTDTVYLGAFRRDVINAMGGYDEDFGGNEDAELAHRAAAFGGVYLDPAIRSAYTVRAGLVELFGQYRRYGRARARTALKHPSSVSWRQLAVPALALGLLSPWRRPVLGAYLGALAVRTALEARGDPAAAPSFALAVPAMHLGWGMGLLEALTAHARSCLSEAVGRR